MSKDKTYMAMKDGYGKYNEVDNLVECVKTDSGELVPKDSVDYIELEGNLYMGGAGGLYGNGDWEGHGVPITRFSRDEFALEMVNISLDRGEEYLSEETIIKIQAELVVSEMMRIFKEKQVGFEKRMDIGEYNFSVMRVPKGVLLKSKRYELQYKGEEKKVLGNLKEYVGLPKEIRYVYSAFEGSWRL